jgi:hypothetical protein
MQAEFKSCLILVFTGIDLAMWRLRGLALGLGCYLNVSPIVLSNI